MNIILAGSCECGPARAEGARRTLFSPCGDKMNPFGPSNEKPVYCIAPRAMYTNGEPKNQEQKATMTAAVLMTSQASIDESKAWEGLASLMEELVSNCDAADEQLKAYLDQGAALIDELSAEKQSLHTRAQAISSSISTQIETETQAFENEANDLALQIRNVQFLEQSLESENKRTAELAAEQRKVQQSISAYKSELNSQSDAIDEIEISHMKQLKKNRRAISMYAQMTNIKWDYSQADVLAGEVSLPKKFEHRRFCVEKDLGEVEIAEKIWGIIDG